MCGDKIKASDFQNLNGGGTIDDEEEHSVSEIIGWNLNIPLLKRRRR